MCSSEVLTKELAFGLLRQLRPIDIALGTKVLRGSPLSPQPLPEELMLPEARLFWLAALTSYSQGQTHSGLSLDANNQISDLFDSREDDELELDVTTLQLLGSGAQLCQDFSSHVVSVDQLEGDPNAYFVYREDTQLVYLQRWYRMEAKIGAFVAERLNRTNKHLPEGFRETFQSFFPPSGLVENPWQAAACFAALKHDFAVITGGPGTGKTTTVTRLIGLLMCLNEGERPEAIHMVAPTGKAAERLRESLNDNFDSMVSHLGGTLGRMLVTLKEEVLRPASTIHSFLGSRGSSGFRHHAGDTVNCDVLIVDESSMVDLELFDALLDALPANCRIVLLGDKNQLSAVGVGNVFSDLTGTMDTAHGNLNAKTEVFRSQFAQLSGGAILPSETSSPALCGDHVIELTKSYRFRGDSKVGRFAQLLLDESRLPTRGELGLDCYYLTDAWQTKLRDSLASYKAGFDAGANAEYLLEEINKVRILCAVRRGEHGVLTMNQMLSEYVLGRASKPSEPQNGLPFIILRNDRNLGLSNGDCGIFQENDKGELLAYLPSEEAGGELRSLNPYALPDWEPAFALTIHKSQGSEYDSVVIILPEMKKKFISWELVYTAITRGKRDVSIILPQAMTGSPIDRFVRRSGLRQELKKS